MSQSERYIHALNFKWLTPIYDPLLRWGMREEQFRRRLIDQANIQPGQRLLDVGCGTGTLTILIKQLYPDCEAVGLDGDPQILDIARNKANKSGVSITWDQGMADQLPYPDQSFDRVFSSLMIHHLSREDKPRMMLEVLRVLRPGGEFHIVDFGESHGVYARLASQIIKRIERASDNLNGLLPSLLRSAGFEGVEEPSHYQTIFGTLSLLRAQKPIA